MTTTKRTRNKPKHKTEKLTIRLSAERHFKLKKAAEKQNLSMSKLLEKQFHELFQQYGLPLSPPESKAM
ncbi:MAG: hypothetical protein KME30_17150 [Iphinoe sp. HA4291-MV1]|jgi:predicted HicB family RNase H-like nuclease|nr:hypothetical protein [Iphinoe sp. HA4291-MV1]